LRRLIQFGVVAGTLGSLLELGAPAALAGGNSAQAFTQTDHHVTAVQHDVNPCTGDTWTLTGTYGDIFHVTVNKTGSWITGTIEGKFTFVPDDANAVIYTGHFATWFGDENNLQTTSSTPRSTSTQPARTGRG
jgi:hypothetical protein